MSAGSFFESLEGRRFLSVTVTSTSDGTLVVSGGNGAQNIHVEEETTGSPLVGTGLLDVFVNFQPVATGVAASKLVVNAGNSGDTISYTGYTVNAVLNGGTGNDTIKVIDAGSASIQAFGGSGQDVLHASVLPGASGSVLLDGGNGNDQVFDDQGPVTILAGNGDDAVFLNNLSQATIDGGNGPDGIFISVDPGDPLGLNSQTAVVTPTGKGSGIIDVTTTQTPPFGSTTSFTTESTFINVSNVYVNGVKVA